MYVGMNYIDGDFCPHRPDFPSRNPATEEEIGLFPSSTSEEVAEAVAAARRAFPKWHEVNRVKRAEYFVTLAQLVKRDFDKIVKAISLETGRNLNESKTEVTEALHLMKFSFGKGRDFAERGAYVFRKPKGAVAIIAPWNYPFAIGGACGVAPALVEGNTVIFKPSEETPVTGQMIAELYNEAGFPPGVFNMIHGNGEVGHALALDNVDHIYFTGSAEVGRSICRVCADSRHKTCDVIVRSAKRWSLNNEHGN
jgi:aldehyde dehydrogenase (NAD+)